VGLPPILKIAGPALSLRRPLRPLYVIPFRPAGLTLAPSRKVVERCLACADDTLVVPETNESNSCMASALQVTAM